MGKDEMAYIVDHNQFVRVIKGFLEEGSDYDLVDSINADSRDRMGESDHYGLRAIEIAEDWFDGLSPADFMGFSMPDTARLAIVQNINEWPKVIAIIEVDCQMHQVNSYGVSKSPIGEDLDMIGCQG